MLGIQPLHIYKAYAGIGSRQISDNESEIIRSISNRMAALGYWLYSGNAQGADNAFQKGCQNKGISFLPWPNYNSDQRDTYGFTSIPESAFFKAKVLHPQGNRLSGSSLQMMARNVLIIEGIDSWPRVELVICCSDPIPNGGVHGGAALCYKLAKQHNIPFINIRENRWENRLQSLLHR